MWYYCVRYPLSTHCRRLVVARVRSKRFFSVILVVEISSCTYGTLTSSVVHWRFYWYDSSDKRMRLLNSSKRAVPDDKNIVIAQRGRRLIVGLNVTVEYMIYNLRKNSLLIDRERTAICNVIHRIGLYTSCY